MISVGYKKLLVAENCAGHPGIRIAERHLYSVSETRKSEICGDYECYCILGM